LFGKGDVSDKGMSVTGAERVAGGGGMQKFQTRQKCMTFLFRYTDKNKLRFSFTSTKFDQKTFVVD